MKMMTKIIASTALTVAAIAGTSASAAPLLVSYTPVTDTHGAFSFMVDSNPVPTATSGNAFVANITNGTGQYLNRTSATFFSLTSGGLFDDYYGGQAFSGATTAPTILTGTYAALYSQDALQAGVVKITAAVPEPATWALMILGMGVVGFAMRRRRGSTMNVSVRFA